MAISPQEIERQLFALMSERMKEIAKSEVRRLVERGWTAVDATLCVEFSPDWPYAHERKGPPGIMASQR